MTSPKTVTPDQPQAVPDMVLVPRVKDAWDENAEQIAHNLADQFGPDFVLANQAFAKAAVEEYLYAAEVAVRPVIPAQAAEVRRETVEQCAQHLTTLADAMHEKAEVIAERESWHSPFALPLASERDAAVMAYDFEQAAAAIKALTDGAKGADHLPDAGNMIAARASSSGEAGE